MATRKNRIGDDKINTENLLLLSTSGTTQSPKFVRSFIFPDQVNLGVKNHVFFRISSNSEKIRPDGPFIFRFSGKAYPPSGVIFRGS